MGARARVRRLELEDFLTEIMDDRNMCAHADTSYIYMSIIGIRVCTRSFVKVASYLSHLITKYYIFISG